MVSDFNNKWSSEEIDRLIMMVQERPDIYDRSRPGHSNLNVIDTCWSEIAHSVPGKSVKTLKTKWQILRGGYRQRRKEGTHSGMEAKKMMKKWAYFESLKFLEPFLVERDSSTNIPTVETFVVSKDECLTSPDSMEDYHAVEDPLDFDVSGDWQQPTTSTCTSQSGTPTTGTSSDRRCAKRDRDDDVEQRIYDYLKTNMCQPQQKSSIKSFLESLEDDMRELSPENLRKFKIKTLSLLNALLENQ